MQLADNESLKINILHIMHCRYHGKWFYDPEGGVLKKAYRTRCLKELKEKLPQKCMAAEQ